MKTLQNIAVIGSGTMGGGIAQWFCQQKINVFLIDKELSPLKAAQLKIENSWNDLEKKGKFNCTEIEEFKNCLTIGFLEEMPKVQLVIEAVFEDLNLKQELFLKLDKLQNEDCIFASNTSSFLMKDLQEKLPKSRFANFLGLHFFNPATIMKLVEIIKAPHTQEEVINDLKLFFNSKHKIPVICQDSPGFIVNRLARHYYGEALRVAEELGSNDFDFKYIDETLMTCGGFKMGPFALMDLIGIDVNLDVTNSVWNAFNKSERFRPHILQEKKVANKEIGKKSKKGFYQYE